MKSWKTTVGGIGFLITQIGAVIWPQYAHKFNEVGAILVAGGLMSARDHNVSSEDAGIKPTTNVPVTVAQPPAK